MRMAKTSSNGVNKTTTRKAVKKAIKSQDTEDLLSSEEIQNAIRMKAYQLFLERGGQWGNPDQDWADAEKLVLNQLKQYKESAYVE